MKPPFLLAILALATATNAATLTLTNANFQASGNNTDPSGWTTSEPTQTSVYVWAANGGIPAGTNVLAMWGNGGQYAQQSFLTSEATADDHGSFTIGFDAGWRGRIANEPFSYTFSIFNVTDNLVLGSATYNFATPTVTTANTYAVAATGLSVTINYDNSLGTLAGDTIALRITGAGKVNDFNNTAWVDNLTVNAVPEPGSVLLGGLGLLALLRRRRA
jgi:PEP-CTERM motif